MSVFFRGRRVEFRAFLVAEADAEDVVAAHARIVGRGVACLATFPGRIFLAAT
jgi:hypothetical protein